MQKEIKEISPWGVQAPFLALSVTYFALSLIKLVMHDFSDHAYFAMIATYAMLYGMLLRLFFPATKYLPAHLIALIAIAIPFPASQAVSALAVTVAEAWGLKDVKSYGSKFPVNYLVLSSPPAGIIAWLAFYFTGNFTFLIPPVVLYVLGINVGVFAATLRSKPFFGKRQLPFLLLSVLSFLKPIYALDVLAYSGYVLSKVRNFKTPSSLVLVSFLMSSVTALFINFVHSVMLGLMLPSFINCVVYSIARYNYGNKPHQLSLVLIFMSLIAWEPLKAVSVILTLLALLIFYALIVHNFYPRAVKLGISVKFLREAK